MNKEVIDFLAMIGVDTRYISLYKKSIFINNLKFSRFSHRREELFLAKHSDYQIIRSKIFQKMCIRASRNLSKCLNPGEKILIHKNGTCSSLILYLILEPYQRKYGIKIIHDDSLEYTTDYDVDSVASSITLDQEVGNLIKNMFKGRKIELTSMKTEKKDIKVVYPLINIPDAWIKIWTDKNYQPCTITPADETSADLLKFLEQYIPDVRENMLKSALFLSE